MTTNAPLARRSSETRLSNEDKSYLIDRSAEATRLALVIGEATTRFVVLHGQPASGKSVLVTKWLLPALRDSRRLGGRRVYFASCTSVIPEAVGDDQSKTSLDEALVQPAIIVMDRFDRVLESPREDRKRQLDTLFAAMSRPTSIATLVVIVDTRQLTSVYSLTAYNPAMASAIEAIRGVGFTEGLTRLGTAGRGGGPVRYTSDALSKLEDEAKQLRLDSTFDFLKLVHARFRALLADMGAEEVDVAHYVAVGGLEGILRDHLDQCIDNAESSQAGTGVVARAALLCVHEVVSRGTTLDIVGLARRYEVSETAVRDVFALLAEPDGPVIGSADAPLGLQPPQLSSILEADRAALQAKNERARRVIEEALRSWRALGTPIPPNRFAEINGQRHELVLDAELARFLAQCALRMQDPELAAFAPYWLSRVASDDDAADILLAALFESDARVRERAARALAPRADARVRDRLCVLALGDDSASVRAAAVESLAWMADEPLLEHLRSEAANVKSPNRANAVHALRIFARPDVTDVLRRLVADCETPLAVRREAVEALGAIGTAASVDALVDIALDDADADDRDAAADALAAVATSELDRRILERLRWPRPIGRIIGVGVFLALVLVIGIAFALVFAGSAAESDQIGWVFLGMIALTVGTGILVRRVASGRIRRRSAAGLLSLALFTTCTVAVIPFFHGLAHFMVKRRQRALR